MTKYVGTSLEPCERVWRRFARRAPWAVCVVVVLAAAPAPAQPRTANVEARGLKLTDFPRFVRLAENVYAYEEIRAPGFTTVSLVVIGKDGVLIADGQGSAQATETMLTKIRARTPLPVRWYVMGSDHGDHTAGNSMLPAGITFLVYPASRTQLIRDSTSAAAANARAAQDAAGRGTEAPAPRVVVVPPRAMTSDSQTVDVGGTQVRALFLGRAHTGGDLVVHLPRERILFMSEVFLNRVFPAMRSAFPSEWVQTIDRALALDVQRFVPGHGFVEEAAASREELVAFRGALVAVIAEATRLHGLGLSADEAFAKANWGAYATWFIADQQAPVAVRKVYEEIEGKLPPRP